MTPRRILVVNPLWPHRDHTIRSANVVIFQLISEMAARRGVTVGFLKLDSADSRRLDEAESAGRAVLAAQGVEFLPPLSIPTSTLARGRWSRLLRPKLEDYYPATLYRGEAEKVAMSFRPDVLFVPWSEWATHLFADLPVAKFAYYGNPDPKPRRVWSRLQFKIDHRVGDLLSRELHIMRQEYFHLREMNKYDIVGNVAANDSKYYCDKGHQRSIYIQNTWIDRFSERWRELRCDLERDSCIKIVGSLGKLNGTANTLGIHYLATSVAPRLKTRLSDLTYEVNLIGGGKLAPFVERVLTDPSIKLRGFVSDIDSELLASQIFLCVNNATRFKVGHTRYLHAWSLGCCVVAHRDASISMPEIEHDRNALLGETPEEIADLVSLAARDPLLRRRIGEGGYQTFRQHFTPEHVVPKILSLIEQNIQSKR